MIGKIARTGIVALVATIATFNIAAASSSYDGSWSLTIATERGVCDPNYYFQVQIYNGNVSHANLVKFKGHVASGGAVHVSVSAGGKTAAGSGRLTATAGKGRWTGRSGKDRCSGSWTAQKL